MGKPAKVRIRRPWRLVYGLAAFWLIGILLIGCASAPTVPERVLVPTPVSCLSAPPPAVPETRAEAEILSMSDYSATIVTWAERLALKAYAERADALLQACR